MVSFCALSGEGEGHLEILDRIAAIARTEEDTDALVDRAAVDDLYRKLCG